VIGIIAADTMAEPPVLLSTVIFACSGKTVALLT
jgi:hypothetical protein